MKFSCVLTLLSLLTLSAAAQESRLEIGLGTGLNISSLHNESFSRYFDWRYTALGNIRLKYNLTGTFSILTDIGYEQKGCKGKNMKLLDSQGNNLGSTHTFTYAYKYITIPVLVRYTSTRFPFFVNGGPYIGYMLDYKETYDITEIERSDDMQKMDVGISLGAGLVYSLSEKWNMSFELRNNLGLTNIRISDAAHQSAPIKPVNDLNPVYNNSINILVGIYYKL